MKQLTMPRLALGLDRQLVTIRRPQMARNKNRFVTAAWRAYLDQVDGEAERLAQAIDVDPGVVSNWKTKTKPREDTMARVLPHVHHAWKERLLDAWHRDKTPPPVWDELLTLRALAAPPVPGADAARAECMDAIAVLLAGRSPAEAAALAALMTRLAKLGHESARETLRA